MRYSEILLMHKILSVLFFLFVVPYVLYSQITPREGRTLNYRLIGFSFPEVRSNTGCTLQIALGNYNSEDSFRKNIIVSRQCKADKIITEVPAFGKEYTWRTVCKVDGLQITKSELHHFSTGIIPFVDTGYTRLRIIKKATKYKEDYVFLDGTKTLYDMEGHPLWYLPDIGGIGLPPRDLKLSPQRTVTFLLDNHAYEVNYNGEVLWKSSNDGKVSGVLGEGYNHEFTRLANGHYMVLGKKFALWELPSSIDSSVLNAPGVIIVKDSITKKYYQKMELGTVIEYDHAGNVVWSWNSSEYLKGSDLYRRRTLEGLFDLDIHENSFYFDEQAKVVYVSCRDVSRILKIKYPEGNVLNSYGGAYIPGDREVQKSLFCHQHSCRLSKEGYLYLFNNNGCNPDQHPKLIMMKEPKGPKDTLEKIWEYDCNVEGMNEKNPIDPTFMAGGNVLELPDHSIFASMCVMYGNMFIVSRDKKILWNAISESWMPAKKKWKVQTNYRASIITRKELEGLIWNDHK